MGPLSLDDKTSLWALSKVAQAGMGDIFFPEGHTDLQKYTQTATNWKIALKH